MIAESAIRLRFEALAPVLDERALRRFAAAEAQAAGRGAQFRYISGRVKEALALSEPAISVDTKKKELVGDFKNAGREWREKDSPEDVRVHDFVIPDGRAVPYGVYDIADDAAGRVSAGVDHDTGAFAVNAVRSWWTQMRRARYPNAKSLLIAADGGGSAASGKPL